MSERQFMLIEYHAIKLGSGPDLRPTAFKNDHVSLKIAAAIPAL